VEAPTDQWGLPLQQLLRVQLLEGPPAAARSVQALAVVQVAVEVVAGLTAALLARVVLALQAARVSVLVLAVLAGLAALVLVWV